MKIKVEAIEAGDVPGTWDVVISLPDCQEQTSQMSCLSCPTHEDVEAFYEQWPTLFFPMQKYPKGRWEK